MLFSGSTHRLFADGELPGGTPLKTWVTPTPFSIGASTAPIPVALTYDTPDWFDLEPGTYRFVTTPLANTTIPRKISVGGSPSADTLTALRIFNGTGYGTEEIAGAWTDYPDGWFSFAPLIVPAQAVITGKLIGQNILLG
jgi:hypothetical protein